MKLPLFQTSEAGYPLLRETYILADGHCGTYTTEILEDRGSYYKVVEWETAKFHGCVQENRFPDLSTIDLTELFGAAAFLGVVFLFWP